MNAITIEQRIAQALSDENISSLDVAALLAETEEASIEADRAAVEARELAFDPIASPDANRARAAVETANFVCARLRTLLPRLQTKYDKVARNEAHAKWASEYERVKNKRDAAAEKLRLLYPEVAAKLVELLLDIEVIDKEVTRINDAGTPFLTDGSPYDARYALLKSVELDARGLDHFGVHDLKILKDLALPSFTEPTKLAWPPYRPVDWSSVVPVFRHPGADWASERERGAA
jgi:hypothetical protein